MRKLSSLVIFEKRVFSFFFSKYCVKGILTSISWRFVYTVKQKQNKVGGFLKKFRGFLKFNDNPMCLRHIFLYLIILNLTWGHARSHSKFGPDRFRIIEYKPSQSTPFTKMSTSVNVSKQLWYFRKYWRCQGPVRSAEIQSRLLLSGEIQQKKEM